MRVSVNRTSIPNDDWATLEGAAMTKLNASPSVRGRRVKFTPQAIEKIKEFVAEGISRDEIANRLGVTVGSLQVTCSRLGISLRRIIFPSCSERRTADVRLDSVGIAHVREQKEVSQPEACAAPVAKLAITMRHRGKARTTDIPLPLPAIETLAFEAMSRDLSIAALIERVLVAAKQRYDPQDIARRGLALFGLTLLAFLLPIVASAL